MVTLDDVQNEIREFEGVEDYSKGFIEHNYRFHEMNLFRLRQIAIKEFSDINKFRNLRGEYNAPDINCFIVLGKEVIGYGTGLAKAVHVAKQKGYESGDGIAMFVTESGFL